MTIAVDLGRKATKQTKPVQSDQCICYLLPTYYDISTCVKFIYTIEPVHEISNNLVCATIKASDQPAHMRSLIRAFASRLSIL